MYGFFSSDLPLGFDISIFRQVRCTIDVDVVKYVHGLNIRNAGDGVGYTDNAGPDCIVTVKKTDPEDAEVNKF